MNSSNIALLLGRAIQLDLEDSSFELYEGSQNNFNISLFEDSDSMEAASDVNSFGEDILELLETRELDDVPAQINRAEWAGLESILWAGLESILQFISDTMFTEGEASDVTSPRNENNCIEQLSLSKILCLLILNVILF